ncbi:MAG: hypothetical protein M1830_009321 [Pleopsidium flavum]|nr:MAG: hypothetical protein M1830_009321 [Pleopsidium flavum]
MISRKSIQTSLASAILLQTALLKHLSVPQRRLETVKLDKEDKISFAAYMTIFADTARIQIEAPHWGDAMEDNAVECDVADLVDGRMLKTVLHVINNGMLTDLIPGTIKDTFNMLSVGLHSLCGVKLQFGEKHHFATRLLAMAPTDYKGKDQDNLAVLPFSNPVFDKHLASIHLSIDSASTTIDRSFSATISREISHWHNAKRALDPKKTVSSRQAFSRRWNPLRSNQLYMAEMMGYAASLTNANGKVLEPETITVGARRLTEGPSTERKRETQKKTGKAIKPTKAQEIIAQHKARKDDLETPKTIARWQTMKQEFDKTIDPESRYLKANAYLNGLESTKGTLLFPDVIMYCMQALLTWWSVFCRAGQKQDGYHVAGLMWDAIRRAKSFKDGMTDATAVHIEKICTIMGLPKAASTLSQQDARPLSFSFEYPLLKTGTLSVDLLPHEFQLLHCGPYMDRNTDACPDPRVPSFEPDGWQRKVLDKLDANQSIFVVAPTSAGKTFISFYAMEKVLRADDDEVLVYVAPTKALVNQIAAEIQARFSKKYPHGGRSVWSIHTRDYRINNPAGCQILVTVPHILQIEQMLLAPSNANSWARRVKRIIFDEIHSIGQAEDGVVWEQLLLLAPCQIIALSATVGNPQQFSDWLVSTQQSAGFELSMIQHPYRYSDLRKFVYTPPKRFAFKRLGERGMQAGRLGLDGSKGLAFFHPVASLVKKSRGMPDDLTLEARDCLSLWTSMVKHGTAKFPVPEALSPKKALPPFIRKVDIFEWEKNLKKVLSTWMTQTDSPFDKVLDEVSKDLYDSQRDEIQVSGGPADMLTAHDSKVIDPDDLCATTLPMLARLNERNALPAILFNYGRLECERIARTVLEQLKAAEEDWKETSPEWKKLIDGWEKWKKMKSSKHNHKAPKAAQKKKTKTGDDGDDAGSKLDTLRDEASGEASFFDNFDPNEPREGFSFADQRKYQMSELREDFRRLERKGVETWLREALNRGIGVHHAGMNRKYRQIVEILFRKGYLRVVIATGTLSLGINMPCATVVFSGDSVFLTALNFRQAAGRAGRRGFDLLGNVVFQGISVDKACRLLSSRLPDLNGHFPITTTLVLRLFTLLHDSNNSPYARQVINSLLSQPRLYLGGDSFKDQVLHHLRFSIEYLRRQGLLGPKGEPLNFTSCISHLYFTENSSFAFHALLRDGYFHNLCADISTRRDSVLRTLMIVMAHLFGRRPCRSVQQEYIEEVVKRSPSVVFLPPMPVKAATVLQNHNKKTLAIFETYVKTFATQHVKEEEHQLPLTGVKVGGEMSQDMKEVLHALPATKARSAFVALSGHGDTFRSISDLCTTTRAGIFLEQAVIPHLELYPNETASPLNAYLYDFYMHGALDPLENANGIRKSDVWFLLNDFSLVLATIITSLANFMHLSADQDLDMTETVGGGDAEMIAEDESLATEATGSKEPQSKPKPKQPATTRKNILSEDWDADGEDLSSEDSSSDYDPERSAKSKLPFEAWSDDERGLMKVYKAFVMLKAEFDEKFLAIWA